MMNKSRKTAAISIAILLALSGVLLFSSVAFAAYTWTNIGGTGSAINAMLHIPGDNILVAGCADGNVYIKNLPSGTWTTSGPGVSSVMCLAYDPNNERVFAGLSNGDVRMLYLGGGWMTAGTPGAGIVYSLAYDPVSDVLHAGCADQHVWRSSPPGAWFDEGQPGTAPAYEILIDSERRVLYASGGTSVYKRTLPGGLWTTTSGPGVAGSGISSMAFDGTRNVLYAGLSVASVGQPNVYRLDVGGAGSWTAIGTLCGGPYIPALSVDETHDFLFAGADNSHIYKNCAASTGSEWADMGLLPERTGGLAFDGVRNAVFAGLQNGAARRTYLPATAAVSPTSGTRGQTMNVEITGTNSYFDSTSTAGFSGSGITVNSCTAGSATELTANITISSTADLGARDVWVDTDTAMDPDRTITLADAFTVNSESSTWYLAEGTTAWGFSTYITIANPGSGAVSAKVTYMPTGEANQSETINLPAKSQTTITNDHLVDLLGEVDFSTKVQATDLTKPLAVDRTMQWTGGSGAAGKGGGPEGHSSVGVTSPARTWYLPEGSTDWGFETWLLIQNPNGSEASCDVTYMIEGEGPKTVNHKVPANSRESFNMETDIGKKDASIKVSSDVTVIPERAMYRYSRREGHDSIGTTTPASNYYLAEGAVGYPSGYVTYVLVQNPQGTPTDVTVTYMTGSGQVAGPAFQMAANSRKTVRVNDQLPANTDVSTTVHGTQAIIAERAMYWSSTAGEACHDSIGMSAAHTTFCLPDGQSSDGRETWTLVQNPNSSTVQVTVTYMTPSGSGNVSKTESIPAHSRKTFNMAEHSGLNGRAAIMVQCKTGGKKIMVERAMYWSSRSAGTDTIGGFSD